MLISMYQTQFSTLTNDTCAWTPNKVFLSTESRATTASGVSHSHIEASSYHWRMYWLVSRGSHTERSFKPFG